MLDKSNREEPLQAYLYPFGSLAQPVDEIFQEARMLIGLVPVWVVFRSSFLCLFFCFFVFLYVSPGKIKFVSSAVHSGKWKGGVGRSV